MQDPPITPWDMAKGFADRMIGLFTRGADGRRPVHGNQRKFQEDPHWRDLILFYEYFHGDTGRGIGASHQTGWSGLVAAIIQEQSEHSVPMGWLTAIAQEHGPEAKSEETPVERLPGQTVRRTRPTAK